MPKDRSYQRTHPWLSFTADLERGCPSDLWTMLGECQSKCDHLANIPLMPATAKMLHQVFLAKGVSATTAIEGNTLSEEQVLAIVKGQADIPKSQAYLETEVKNIIDACNAISDKIVTTDCDPHLCVEDIKSYNRMVLRALPLKDGGTAGEVSPFMVGVPGYRGAPREDCEYLLDRLCGWLQHPSFGPKDELGIGMAIIKAIIAHLYLAWIHPFPDGNGRTARLMEFRILLASGVPAPAAHLLSNHYNKTRSEYYRQLDYASKSGGRIEAFLFYAIQGFRDGLREQIKFVVQQQIEVIWRDYLHEMFRGNDGPVGKRRLHLILDISEHGKPLRSRTEIGSISARVAQAYSDKTDRVLRRDIATLVEMRLLRLGREGYRANKSRVLGFRPRRRQAKLANQTRTLEGESPVDK